jgi:hypothetical protein
MTALIMAGSGMAPPVVGASGMADLGMIDPFVLHLGMADIVAPRARRVAGACWGSFR